MFKSEFWNFKFLVIGNLIATLLFVSWLYEPTRSFWIAIDTATFWAMNNSLSWCTTWQWIWALGNNRGFDLVAAIGMLSVFTHYAFSKDRKNLHRYMAILLFTGLVTVVTMEIGSAIPIERKSPTQQFSDVTRLSELVTQIRTKDSSGDSFPGDHGTALLVFAGFALFYLTKRYGAVAVILAMVFGLPRLMSGAHWLTDEIVGALSLVLMMLTWVFSTPFHHYVLQWLEKKVLWACQRFSSLCNK